MRRRRPRGFDKRYARLVGVQPLPNGGRFVAICQMGGNTYMLHATKGWRKR